MSWFYITVILYLTNLTVGEQPKIIIIGAGASGIAAASKLYENGFQDLTILEAEDRIGGRVFTTWFDKSWVDLGAQWVSAHPNNIAFELAEPLGLLGVKNVGRDIFIVYNSDGNLIPKSTSDHLMQLFNELEENYSDATIASNVSIGEYQTSAINAAAATKLPAINETLVRQFLKLMEGMENKLTAADNWYDLSLKGSLDYEERVGNVAINWKDRGYGTILEVLIKKIPNPENELPVRNNTKLNSEVVKIDYNSTEGKVSVELSNGKKYIADHVIFTPSLGVLKEQHENLFSPALPEQKIKTIKDSSFGVGAKLYLSFESPWWPSEDFNYFGLVWDENERQEYERDVDKKWLLDLTVFQAMVNRPRLLCGWVYGAGARYMETLPKDQVLNQTLTILHKFLGKSYNISTPTGFLRSRWYSNKHFRGTYSYKGMENHRADFCARDLSTPLIINDKPIVLFAGEATSPNHFGTVHGAIETGFREANRLINLYNVTTI